ncbi:hypothetical protein MTR_7g018450 [Medicago truncatula]|uniref:Uncharacterized protein n=1 Tax=Medicago truncatula TaxID=3880 RepID=A0A072TWE4_MEDTR|nr:hypothetical protein MTR_7g018450 [Medicago truncatula]
MPKFLSSGPIKTEGQKGRGYGHNFFDNFGSTVRSRLRSISLFDNCGSTGRSRLGSSSLPVFKTVSIGLVSICLLMHKLS